MSHTNAHLRERENQNRIFELKSDVEINKVVAREEKSGSVVSLDDASAPSAEETNQQSLLPLHGVDLKEYLANLEKDLIEQALDDSGGVVARGGCRTRCRSEERVSWCVPGGE